MAKQRRNVNPVQPDGTRKKGRPLKDPNKPRRKPQPKYGGMLDVGGVTPAPLTRKTGIKPHQQPGNVFREADAAIDVKNKRGWTGKSDTYRKEIHLPVIFKMACEGRSNADIYRALGIVAETWYKWRVRHSDIEEALKKAYDERVNQIRAAAPNALLRLIEGGEIREKEEKYEYVTDDTGKKKKVVTEIRERTKVVQPNPTAVIFALSNLDMANFPNKQRFEAQVAASADTVAAFTGGGRGISAAHEDKLAELAAMSEHERNQAGSGE